MGKDKLLRAHPDLHDLDGAVKVLFIQGERDPAVRPHFTREAARRVPGARLEMLANHGHWPNRQSPRLVNSLILEFLSPEP